MTKRRLILGLRLKLARPAKHQTEAEAPQDATFQNAGAA